MSVTANIEVTWIAAGWKRYQTKFMNCLFVLEQVNEGLWQLWCGELPPSMFVNASMFVDGNTAQEAADNSREKMLQMISENRASMREFVHGVNQLFEETVGPRSWW